MVDRQTTTATDTGTTARTKHAVHIAYTCPKSLVGEMNHSTLRYRDKCMPLVSSADTVYYYDLRVAQLKRDGFPPLCFVSKCYSLRFGTLSPCHKSDKMHVCNRASACAYFFCTSLNYIDVPSRLGTQPLVMLVCGFSGAVIVITSRFSHACACHVYPCTYVSTEVQ